MKKENYFITVIWVLLLLVACQPKKEKPKDLAGQLNEAVQQSIESMSGEKRKDPKQFKKILKDFKSSEDDIERLELCTKVMLAKVNFEIAAVGGKEKPQFSDKEQSLIAESEKFCAEAGEMLTDFERSLTPQEIQKIASQAQDSLLPYTKAIFSRPLCSDTELIKLKELDPPLKDSIAFANIMVLANGIESSNYEKYFKEYKKIAEEKSHPRKKLLLYILDKTVKQYKTAGTRPGLMGTEYQRKQRAIKKLNAAGVKNVDEYVRKAVQLAPGCLGHISPQALNKIKVRMSKDNMEVYYNKLKKYVDVFDRFPDVRPDSHFPEAQTIYDNKFEEYLEPIGVKSKDEYGRPFFVIGSKNSFKIYSMGKDKRPHTDDDLYYEP